MKRKYIEMMGNNDNNDSSKDIEFIKHNKTFSKEDYERIRYVLKQYPKLEWVKKRDGPQQTVLYYYETWLAIELMNEVFGALNWSREILEKKTKTIKNDEDGKFSAICTCTVKITLIDGSYQVGTGEASIINKWENEVKSLIRLEKSAESDATKRAIRGFGRLLGGALYEERFRYTLDVYYMSKIESDKIENEKRSNDLKNAYNSKEPIKLKISNIVDFSYMYEKNETNYGGEIKPKQNIINKQILDKVQTNKISLNKTGKEEFKKMNQIVNNNESNKKQKMSREYKVGEIIKRNGKEYKVVNGKNGKKGIKEIK